MLILGPKRFGDGVFMPFGETPEAHTALQQMCEGRLIARVCWDLNADLPAGSSGFGLEFAGSGPGVRGRNWGDLGQGGERLVVMAIPVTAGRWITRLLWRWMPAQQLWTRGMRRHFGTDRVSAGEAGPDFLQRQIEGQMIRAVSSPRDHIGMGERVDFELTDGSVMIAESLPVGGVDPQTGRPAIADLDVRREDRRQRVIVGLGG